MTELYYEMDQRLYCTLKWICSRVVWWESPADWFKALELWTFWALYLYTLVLIIIYYLLCTYVYIYTLSLYEHTQRMKGEEEYRTGLCCSKFSSSESSWCFFVWMTWKLLFWWKRKQYPMKSRSNRKHQRDKGRTTIPLRSPFSWKVTHGDQKKKRGW